MWKPSSDNTPTFGFLGVGAIGGPIAERILAHTPIIICDSNEKMLIPFRDHTRVTTSAAELGAMVDIVFACLPSLEAHRKALLDPQLGVVAGKRFRGFVQVGTTGPVLAKTFATELANHDVTMVDAPVTGGVPRAKAGTLTVMTSGDAALYDVCLPLIRTYASHVVFVGDKPGGAQTMKLINNLLSAANLAIGCEAMVLGAKIGFAPEKMLEVLNEGTGQNSATLTKIPDHILPRSFDYGGRLELVCKDLKELVMEARGLGLDMPLAFLVEEIYRRAVTLSSNAEDMTTVIRHMEDAAGVEVRREG